MSSPYFDHYFLISILSISPSFPSVYLMIFSIVLFPNRDMISQSLV